ncbi:unnamed protein product, partial [Closterium sp. NIES-54]
MVPPLIVPPISPPISALIPPLPDDVSVACLSRLSLWDLAIARCVSRGWAAAIVSDAFAQQRRRQQALGAQRVRRVVTRHEEDCAQCADSAERPDCAECASSPACCSHRDARDYIEGKGECDINGGNGYVCLCAASRRHPGRLDWFAFDLSAPARATDNLPPASAADCASSKGTRWTFSRTACNESHRSARGAGSSCSSCGGGSRGVVLGTGDAVRHVSLFDWLVGRWVQVQHEGLAERLDPVVVWAGGRLLVGGGGEIGGRGKVGGRGNVWGAGMGGVQGGGEVEGEMRCERGGTSGEGEGKEGGSSDATLSPLSTAPYSSSSPSSSAFSPHLLSSPPASLQSPTSSSPTSLPPSPSLSPSSTPVSITNVNVKTALHPSISPRCCDVIRAGNRVYACYRHRLTCFSDHPTSPSAAPTAAATAGASSAG